MDVFQNLNVRAALLSIVILVLFLTIWEQGNKVPDADKPMSEYERLMGGLRATGPGPQPE